jgi:predicted kinase
MQAVILIGVPGAGKTSFYRERFFDTHVRISLDMLGTRERERILVAACLTARQAFVIDNTNVLASDRAGYIAAAKQAGFRITGYFFETERRGAIARNKGRTDKNPLPVPAILRAFKRLEPPAESEGFDEIFTVKINADRRFEVLENKSSNPPNGGRIE